MRKIPKRYMRPIPLPEEKRKAPEERGGDIRPRGSDIRPRGSRRLNVPSVFAVGPWDGLGFTLALGGGVYPLLAWLVWVVCAAGYAVLYPGMNDLGSVLEAGVLLMISLLGAMLAGCVVLFYVGILTVLCLLAVELVVNLWPRWLGWANIGVFSGGLVACGAWLPFTLGEPLSERNLPVVVAALLMGPGLAILWGMLVGAYAGIGNERRFDASRQTQTDQRFTFSIMHLLLLTLVVSVLLTLMRLAVEIQSAPLMLVTGWLTLHMVCYAPALAVARWWRHHRAKRYHRGWRKKQREIAASGS